MKHSVLILLSFALILSCNIGKNKVVYSERAKKDILIGECNRKAFNFSPFNEWFSLKYEEYKPDSLIIKKIKTSEELKKINIFIVMGTWCGDSRREIPRFYKIIDEIGFPLSKLVIVAVDTNKRSKNKMLESVEFERIPTFIFYKNQKEVGRIVESTKKSLEEDMLNIIK